MNILLVGQRYAHSRSMLCSLPEQHGARARMQAQVAGVVSVAHVSEV